VVTCKINHWNYFTLFQCFISHVTTSEIISKLLKQHWTHWKIFISGNKPLEIKYFNIWNTLLCPKHWSKLLVIIKVPPLGKCHPTPFAIPHKVNPMIIKEQTTYICMLNYFQWCNHHELNELNCVILTNASDAIAPRCSTGVLLLLLLT